jgi:hypothetical protein
LFGPSGAHTTPTVVGANVASMEAALAILGQCVVDIGGFIPKIEIKSCDLLSIL